jgi:UDP-glucose:glycoprotein glucosyltransferase
LIGPITPNSLVAEDFEVLEAYEYRKRIKPVIDLLKTMYDDITVFDRYVLSATYEYRPADNVTGQRWQV